MNYLDNHSVHLATDLVACENDAACPFQANQYRLLLEKVNVTRLIFLFDELRTEIYYLFGFL